MKTKRYIALILILLTFVTLGWKSIIYNPLIRGDVDGVPFVWTFPFADVTADTWFMGDSTAAGMYAPSQPIEITNVELFGDPDSGDSIMVLIYDGQDSLVAYSDTLVGTTWANSGTAVISDDYAIITESEGIGIFINFIAGTPNSCTLIIEGIYRQDDSDE